MSTQISRQSFLKFLAAKTVVLIKNEGVLYHAIDKLFTKATETFTKLEGQVTQSQPTELFCTSQLLKEQLQPYTKVLFGSNKNG